MIIDGFTVMLIVTGIMFLIPIFNFSAIYISKWIYMTQMKELKKRLWYYRMGLTETGCLTKHTRFLK